MHPETVEIKVTVSAAEVSAALTELALPSGKSWSILFLEDVSTAVSPATPLLDLGVILRARRKSEAKGDATVKLRPCRGSQLADGFTTNGTEDDAELKIEADWAGPKHSLAASLTVDWSDGRVDEVLTENRDPVDLFTKRQQEFLTRCAGGPINLAAVTALPSFQATRWDPIVADLNGIRLSIRPERWTLPGFDDFLELSIASDPEHAERDQAALDDFVTARSLTPDQSGQNKTQRVLSHLVTRTGSR